MTQWNIVLLDNTVAQLLSISRPFMETKLSALFQTECKWSLPRVTTYRTVFKKYSDRDLPYTCRSFTVLSDRENRILHTYPISPMRVLPPVTGLFHHTQTKTRMRAIHWTLRHASKYVPSVDGNGSAEVGTRPRSAEGHGGWPVHVIKHMITKQVREFALTCISVVVAS